MADALLVAGAPGALARAATLIAAHRELRTVEVLELEDGPPASGWWAGRLDSVGAAILLTAPDVPLADAVPGTHLDDGGAHVPVGVVPDAPAALRALADLQRRGRQRLGAGPVVVLASREDRALQLAGRLVAELSRARRLPTRRLTAERLARFDLLRALALGPGVALYVGQGHALGWGGYGGIEAWQLDVGGGRPMGALLSLTCHAASRAGASPSFSEEVVRRGLAGAAVGAAGFTPHTANAQLAIAVAQRVAAGARTVAAALPSHAHELRDYRIAGDPLAPLVGARGARREIADVFAPAPGDPLPSVSWSLPAGELTASG